MAGYRLLPIAGGLMCAPARVSDHAVQSSHHEPLCLLVARRHVSASAPVKSPFGWHIIQVEEKHPATHATLAASTAQIKDTLTQQAEQQQIPVFLQQLRAKANITISDPRFSDLFPPPLPEPPPAAAPAAGQ